MINSSEIKITIIYDNNLFESGLLYGFGFSCLVECGEKKIIFDTGGDKIAFFYNIKKLNIEINTITHIVFSHQHWDHTAGFKDIIGQLNDRCIIYVPFKFDKKLLNQIPKEKLLNKVFNITEVDRRFFLIVLKGSSCVLKDCFSVYEQFLIIKTSSGLLVLTGCAHPGIKNILRKVQTEFFINISWVIGGFHLHRSWNYKINSIINDLGLIGIRNIAPCHCTGKKALRLFKNRFNEKFHSIGAGSILYL